MPRIVIREVYSGDPGLGVAALAFAASGGTRQWKCMQGPGPVDIH